MSSTLDHTNCNPASSSHTPLTTQRVSSRVEITESIEGGPAVSHHVGPPSSPYCEFLRIWSHPDSGLSRPTNGLPTSCSSFDSLPNTQTSLNLVAICFGHERRHQQTSHISVIPSTQHTISFSFGKPLFMARHSQRRTSPSVIPCLPPRTANGLLLGRGLLRCYFRDSQHR